ncbi:MAG TPA: VOC family protein [Marmoricola sp.]|nr:VOC family protein [Marmoricola sp.]
MYLENLVFDAADPGVLGRFWEAVVGGERLTDEPDGFETRLHVEGGLALDLCFQRVPERPEEPPRLRPALAGGTRLDSEAERLLGLGAGHLDGGRRDASRIPLTDPEGNPFDVLAEPPLHEGTGPLAALLLDSADPDRDAEFWSWLTGWTGAAGIAPRSLRHPSQRGPVLELCPESTRKGSTKNRLHLDVRLETGDDPDELVAGIAARGGRELHPAWGELPWRLCADPSGNELCLLPTRPADRS